MNIAEMLHRMCQETLSNADVNAICKARGFSKRESATRALFENFFLSETGVAAAMAGLSREEAMLLHLLHHLDKAVDVTVLARVYGAGQGGYRYGTFTQRYRETFSAARTNLVRRGILLMAEAPLGGDTQMERWRFRFPPQFERFLPPLFETIHTWRSAGEVNAQIVRDTLAGLVQKEANASLCADSTFNLRLVDGELRMGKRSFRAAYLEEWQRACWAQEMVKAVKPAAKPSHSYLDTSEVAKGERVSVDAALTYALSRLGTLEWVAAEQLAPILEIFSGKPALTPARICDMGWRWGCLARHVEESAAYFRLPPTPDGKTESVEPDRYLHPVGDGVTIDLQTVPYDHLEPLAQIARLRVEHGMLHAAPDLIRLGRAPAEVQQHPLLVWLCSHAPAFRKALKTVGARWGKQIVHENLVLARINDLSLKVTLQRTFEGNNEILFLPNDTIAFPSAWQPEVERAVQKAGHVVKTVVGEW